MAPNNIYISKKEFPDFNQPAKITDRLYTLTELKTLLTEKTVSDELSKDNINFDSGEADYIDDRFSFVFKSFINAIEKIYE